MIEAFLQHWDEARDLRVTDGDRESPDFILDHAIGVEIEALIDERLAAGYAALQRLRSDLAPELEELGEKIFLHVVVSYGHPLKHAPSKVRRQNVRGLLAVAKDHLATGKQSYYADHLASFGVSHVDMVTIMASEPGVGFGGNYRGKLSGWVQQAIDKKSEHVDAYHRNTPGFQSLWLLLAANRAQTRPAGWGASLWVEAITDEVYRSPFDRVFVLDFEPVVPRVSELSLERKPPT